MLDKVFWVLQEVAEHHVDVVHHLPAVLRELPRLEDRVQQLPRVAQAVRVVLKHDALVESGPALFQHEHADA